ncbi:MAG TPA: hypothetical protein DCE52_10685 [Rhodobacteraceae bacterium]|nr:hypothetical protein [Paracoccaceae bacterium]
MKILIISNLFYPDRGGGASVFSDLCYGLCERGHDVQVLTSYPYYPEWNNKSSANLWKVQKEKINKVNLFRYGLYIPSNPSSLLQRLLYELSFTLSLLRSLFSHGKNDVTMVYCPLLGAVLYAVLRKWVRREKLWLNVQDIPADAATASGISENKLFDVVATKTQSLLFRQADITSTISPVMVERVDVIAGRIGSCHYLPNWLNRSMAELIESLKKRIFDSASSPQILYAGNIGKKQGLLSFCKELQKSELKFHFQIYGDGGEIKDLKKWIHGQKDERFSIAGFLPEADFVEALYKTDFFLITETTSVGASFIPSKLIPCIGTGTPIVALCDPKGPLGQEVIENGLGIVLKRSDHEHLREVLSNAFIESPSFKKMKTACLKRAEAYSRDVVLDKFERILK